MRQVSTSCLGHVVIRLETQESVTPGCHGPDSTVGVTVSSMALRASIAPSRWHQCDACWCVRSHITSATRLRRVWIRSAVSRCSARVDAKVTIIPHRCRARRDARHVNLGESAWRVGNG